MPEEKPWEKYNSDNGQGKPWETFSVKKEAPYKDAFSSVNTDIYNEEKKDDNFNKVESAIEFIAKNPLTKGGMIDVDKDALRNVMTNPRASKEQISESIATMQSGNPYYIKNENGVMMPKELKDGAQPPKGYDVQSVFGTQKEANDDSWYTDLGKSLYNGAVGAVEGVAQLGQLGTQLVTGEESETLGSTINAINSLKLAKDEDLNKSMYNTEGIKEWGDLVSKERFDFSPSALWGTLNSVAESAVSFMTGAGAAAKFAKGVQGVEKLGQLSKGAKYASAFTGSTLQMVGDNLDNAREAGLTGRDASMVALAQTAAQAGIDAGFGIESALFRNLIGNGEKEVFKNIIRTVEKDATGAITEQGFKDLAKETAAAYTQIAKTGLKEYGKSIVKEGGQEVAQDFVAKSAEQLWDKLSDEDKAKFGTNAFDAKSFGQYIQSGLAGMVGGASMGALNTQAKKKYEEQSANAYKTVQKGEEAVNELKANLNVAKEKGYISADEHKQAVFKVDAYNKYEQQTKDLNLDDKQKKEAFELSFNIEALKSEIDFKPEELEKLDPIAHAKIDSKKKMIKGLQEELNKIILKQDVQTETKVPQTKVDEVAKEFEPKKEGEKKPMTLKELNEKLGGINSEETEKVDLEPAPDENVMDYDVDNVKSMVRRPIDKFTTQGFNKMAETNPKRVKAIVQEHLKTQPNNQMDVTVRSGKNKTYTFDIGENKQVKAAQSVVTGEEGKDFFKYKNLPEKRVEVLDRGGNPVLDEQGEPEFYYEEPVVMKRLDFESKNKEGEPMKKGVVAVYNKQSGEFISYIREHGKGKSAYSEADKYHLKKIYDSNLYNEETMGKYAHGKAKVVKETASEPVKKESVKETPKKVEVKKEPVAKKEEVKPIEKEVVKKSKPKPELDKEAKSITEKIFKSPSKTFEEAVIRHFYKNGKISTADFKRYTGFGERNKLTGKIKGLTESRKYIWAYKNDAQSVDNLVKNIWTEDMNRDESDFDEKDRINELSKI